MWWRQEWRPYIPVAQRRANAEVYAKKLAQKEKRVLAPIKLAGRTIAASFWGLAWCDNLESYSDFANRLPRGRSYIRNGSVIDLQIERGKVKALVSGSDVYTVTIEIATLAKALWKRLKNDCAGSIDSLIDLLGGRFDDGVMTRLSRQDDGMFPKPAEIRMDCSCPDWADMCKHCAAVLYGIGARLDSAPELLFTLRGVEHAELIGEVVSAENLDRSLQSQEGPALPTGELGEMFGIDLVGEMSARPMTKAPPKGRVKKVVKPRGAKAARKPDSTAQTKPAGKNAKRRPKPG
jgi:uncharacterized Zn finger protein